MFKTEIIGNLTKDPQTREFTAANGDKRTVCNFDVAVDTGYGDNKKTHFVRISVWGKSGEACAKYLAKGKKIYAKGIVTANAYVNKDGQPAGQLQLNADEIEFLSPAGGNGASAAPAPQANYSQAGFTEEPSTDDLPF